MSRDSESVHSGYQISLEYDLVQINSKNVQSIEDIYSQKDELSSLLTAWRDKVSKGSVSSTSRCPTILAYICDAGLAGNTLSFKALKGKDRLRANTLKEICARVDIGLYLAKLKRYHTRYCDNDDDD